ncbi:hypothetical protein KVR01_004549 [Diaporthe batatas]|uniref:uncharacterized protein n=1 Tax=Diaporthe batatas TaxID=748121 RepID=UPI001D0391A3|nr:uncharacterized protein KVR01_004549 [Diaporthe batatas]KAG8165997.1 hypothetical protein KVR01_004549 [Diaporthe batatas]
MFVCRACARRASTSVLRQVPHADGRLAVLPRQFGTSSLLRQGQDQGDAFAQFEASVERQKTAGDVQADKKKSLEKAKRAMKKELQYTTDPYHIADNVLKKLKQNDFDRALLLTREASKDKQCVVSWNHCIEYQFKNNKLHAAIKLFNEMKKRAQLPNAQTYTVIFRGCAESQHPTAAVGEALKIYNAMLASSRLKPNITHLNAVLDVCAKAQDLESMFVTLRSADNARAPNNWTYTIILNALRHQPSNSKGLGDSDRADALAVQKSIETTIQRGKLVWDEVMARWKKNEIVMDEELMCAMGRLLLLGGAKEIESILALLSNVLGAPRFDKEQLPASGQIPGSDQNDNSQATSAPRTGEQQQRQLQGPSKPMAGKNTLSLVMKALGLGRRTKLAARYWDYLTGTFGIAPDRWNYEHYLDVLSTGAASGKAARVIEAMPADMIDGRIIRRGLLMCHFDGYNENSFENATVIFDTMMKKMRTPDAECMKLFLQVSTSSYRKFDDRSKFHVESKAKLAYGRQIFNAVDRVWEPLRLATNALTFSANALNSRSPDESWKRDYPNRKSLLDVAKRVVAVCDKVISQSLVQRGSDDARVILIRRKVMNDYVQRALEKNIQLGKGFKRSPGDGDNGEFTPAV